MWSPLKLFVLDDKTYLRRLDTRRTGNTKRLAVKNDLGWIGLPKAARDTGERHGIPQQEECSSFYS